MTTYMTGSFTLPGVRQLLACDDPTGNWSLGAVSDGQLGWVYAGDSSGPGSLADGLRWVGDFTGSGMQSVLYYNLPDQNWWLAQCAGQGAMLWSMIGNTTGFGQVGDGRPIWVGDFCGDGTQQILFYFSGDGNWWLGRVQDMNLVWNLACNTKGKFDSLSAATSVRIGDFTGLGNDQLLYYSDSDYNWWLGTFADTTVTWAMAGNTSGFGQVGDGRPIWVGDFCGDGTQQILFYFSGDCNWWLGSFTGTSLGWTLASNTSGLGQVGDGRPIWIGDFCGDGAQQVLFYFSGDCNWWLGSFTDTSLGWTLAGNTSDFDDISALPLWTGDFAGSSHDQVLFHNTNDDEWWMGSFRGGELDWHQVGIGMETPAAPTLPPSRMLMVKNGIFSAPYVEPYNLDNSDFTLSLMLQPNGAGTILSGRNFTLGIGEDGSFTLVGIDASGKCLTTTTGTTTIIGDNQCHIVTAVVRASGSQSLYLDSALLTAATTSATGSAPAEQPLTMGGTGTFMGGIMNLGLWNWVIPADQFQFVGQGLIGAVGMGDGLLGFWPLNGALNDISPYANDFASSDNANYMACLNCLSVIGPHEATIIEIGNPGITGDVSTQTYAQSVYVPPDASVLSAFVCNLDGGVDFPTGLVLTITSPSGVVYGNTKVVATGVGAAPDAQGTSLHALLVTPPEQGYWQIAISVPASVAFHFMLQVFPVAEHWQAAVEQAQNSGIHQRHMMRTQSFGGWLGVIGGGALTVVGTALVFTPLFEMSPLVVTAGMTLSMHGVNNINSKDSLSQAAARVTITPPPPPAPNAWMKGLSDTVPLGKINLPGTHDSAAAGWGSPWTCHFYGIASQLAHGIRVLDIRLKVSKPSGTLRFQTCHGDLGLGMGAHIYGLFQDVLSACKSFLAANPSECIVMSVKVDDRSGLEPADYISGLNSFLTTQLGSTLYDLTQSAMPTLGQVRGKVYCLNRVDSTSNSVGVPIGIDDNTPDQTMPVMTGHRDFTVRVQDQYDYMSWLIGVEADKTTKVINLFGTTPPSAGLTLNFMSGVKANFLGVYIQNRIIDYIGANKPTFLGWLMMDYASRKYATTRYTALSMIDLVIASNSEPAYSSYPEPFAVAPFVATAS